MQETAVHESQRAIGIFDSGLGGLTVARAVRRALPNEDLIYLGDTARVPYGNKGAETVTRFTRECLDWLHAKGVKMMIVGCNTASSLALPELVNEVEEPTLGVVEAGVKGALRVLGKGPVGVIGTRATVESEVYRYRLKQLRPDIEVLQQACPLFVPLVEEGWFDHPVTRTVIQEYLGPMRARGVEAIILGCTHYPLLKGALADFFNKRTVLVDSADETAKEVKRLLELRQLLADRQGEGHCTFHSTDQPKRLVELGSRVFWDEIEAAHLARVGGEG